MTFRLRCPRSRFGARQVVREILSGAGLLCLLPICLSANPTGGAVVAGSASIAGQGTSAVTIHQASNLAIINWQSFSINSGESTSFLQPGATSAALNRVLGGQTSLIDGTLSANGQVYLVNGNGVIVGPGGVITAGAFTASTRDIANADFLSGNLHFAGSSPAGVQNLGTITALGGNVALIGRTVDNAGTITAPNGTAGLVAADDVLLAQNNADGSTITVSPVAMAPSAGAPVGVKNSGTIAAAAAELKAANGNIYGLAVQNLGTIRATTLSHQGGHIWLTSDSGKVSNAGQLDASATAAGGKGGSVTVKSSTGSVSHTGQIVAKGGTGGTGGQAEISGAQVQFTGSVDLSAPGGMKGNLILDPATIDIVTGGGSDITASTIDPSAVVAALLGANVTLTGTTSITVDDEIDASGNASPGNLILDTPTLNLNAPVILNGSLSGTAGTVNVSAAGLVQNGVDAAPTTGGTVNLAAGAVYALSQEVLINKVVNIEGNGATLSGQGSTRVMEIDGGTVGLDNLVITGGNGNSSIGNGTSFNDDGGGLLVYSQGATSNVTITNSTFVGNSGSSGGALCSVIISGGGTSILVEDSTFTGNSAINGSVLYNDAGFGPTTSVTFKEDTIVANSGNGAIYNTVLSSGGAVVAFNNTILVGNTSFSGESDYVSGGGDTLTDLGYNLYGANGNAGGFVSTMGTDILLTSGIVSVVAPLSLYGGTTPTMALVAFSPALEAGDPAYIGATDQRGINRGSTSDFTGSSADIGAFEAQFVEVQADPVSTVYGNPPVLTFSVTGGPSGSVGTVSGTPALISPATNAGFYGEDIGQGTVTSSPMYVVDFTDGDLTITPRPVVVVPDPGQGKIYGTADPVLTYTTDPADATTGLVNGDTLTGSPDYAGSGQFTSVGSYATTLGTVADSTGNYSVTLTSAPPSFTITPRVVLIDVDPGQTKIYGTSDPVLTYTPEPADATTGLVNGDTLSGSADYLGSGPFTGVGSYPTTPGTLSNPNYVAVPGAPSVFTITPRAVTVLPDSGQSKIYGTPDPVLTYTTTPADATTGLVGEDSLSGSPGYNGTGQFTSVGSYATNLGTLSNSNYTIGLSAFAPTFSITPRSVVVNPDPGQGEVYGFSDPVLTYTTAAADATTGLVNGDTLSGSPGYFSRGSNPGVGLYATNLGTLANSNYTLSLGSAPAFTISPATLYYVADPVTVPADATSFPIFTGTVSGFVAGDTQASATTGTLVFTTPVSPGVPTGYYPIDGSGLSATNYTFMQLAVNSVALTVGMPVQPVTPVQQAAMPNNPVSQSAAQTTSTTTTQDPNQSLPGGTQTPLVSNPAPPTVDINVTSISPNETIDSTPVVTSAPGEAPAGTPAGPPGQGQDATSTDATATTPVAQGSSFDPDIGASPVHGGETVTVGGHVGGPPPPPIVAMQLNSVLGDQALGTLTGALADAGSTPTESTTTAATATTPASATGQASTPASTTSAGYTPTPAAVAAATSKSSAPPPLPPGGTMVAPGQTITIVKGHTNVGPPPSFVQASFDNGFSSESRSTLSDAAGIGH